MLLAESDLRLVVGNPRNGKRSRPAAPPFDHPAIIRQSFKSASHPGRELTIREIGALPDFDDITVRIADVAAYLAVFGNRLRNELGPSAFP